jgi:hypothetical protein
LGVLWTELVAVLALVLLVYKWLEPGRAFRGFDANHRRRDVLGASAAGARRLTAGLFSFAACRVHVAWSSRPLRTLEKKAEFFATHAT